MIELRRRYSEDVQSPSFSRLPAGYQEVEWIQNTGGGYIDLPFDRANIKFKFTVIPPFVHPTTMQMGYGGASMVGFVKNINNDFIQVIVNGLSTGVAIPTNEKKIHEIEIRHSDSAFLIDGIDCNPNKSSFQNKTNFSIFRRNGYTLPDMCGNMYVLQMDSGNGYNDVYIPCYRTSDRKPGMYDIVNDVFYTNDGTGEFSYGPDVYYNIPPEYQQVEYLESTGTQYMVVNFDSQYHSSGIYHAIGEHMTFGVYNDYGSNSLQLYDYGNDSATIRVGIAVSTSISPSPNYIQMDTGTGKIIYDDNIIQIDGALPPDFHFLQGIPLFGRFNTLNIDPKPSVFKRFYVFSKNRIILDLIPCYRKEDEVAGMYDLVSGEFYINAGTGKFDVGPVVIG